MPGVALQDAFDSRTTSPRGTKGRPAARPRGARTPGETKPYGRTPYDFSNPASTLLRGGGPSAGVGTRGYPAPGDNQAAARAQHLIASSGLGAGRKRAQCDGIQVAPRQSTSQSIGSDPTESARMHLLPL
ncbi:uncharacterized protein SCHCODRAFT_02668406 [Schizophyllum commune H4-8]|uniref:Expressed protein n=1 Tax=Schizophyllum commune (strain H4-8 / FGSC 9210) TaxID=578458 RepID=D8Q6F4_SCHCM|nr:uncharacterized protein SCHCODRAFT_02668406 [Schizophyllum commune H4-8]KAI5890966.1 hypothetical protein SCHCODRAFT_02668406 [Schizophyllum commune H4-8]